MKRTPLKRKTPLKRGAPLKRKTPLSPRSKTNSRQPSESSYMNWIRSLPCVCCEGAKGKSEAAHTTVLGKSGIGAKSPNRSTIPLCAWCHRLATDAYHALTPERMWAEYHALDLPKLVADLNTEFQQKREAHKASLRTYVIHWVYALLAVALTWILWTLAPIALS
jgi:hypothetical protein